MTTILLGNTAPHEAEGGIHHRSADGSTLHRDVPVITRTHDPRTSNVTTIEVPEHLSPDAAVVDVEHAWGFHSSQPPSYVEGDDEALVAALRAHFGVGGMTAVEAYRAQTMLKTNGGVDFIAAQLSGSASASAVAKWMALTANSTAESASDTTLASEITTGGGGLVRVASTYAHTGGTATYTLTNTFTANGSDSLPVTLAKIGVFTASSSGTMVYEKLLGTTVTLSVSGDNVTITYTLTIA